MYYLVVADTDAVRIQDRDRAVVLATAGSSTECGQPTSISFQAGPFAGTILDDTVGDFETFHYQLGELHRSLSGSARLTSYEGFSLTLTGIGLGAISVEVKAAAGSMLSIRLEYDFEIDQSYLPQIIQAIDELFLSPTRPR